MPFIKINSIKIGDYVKTKRKIESCVGCVEQGGVVKIIAIENWRGYGIEDEFGNRIFECGWGCVENNINHELI